MRADAAILLYGPPLAPPVELSRWLLDRLAIPYRFETAAAGLSAIRSRREKVPVELPLLTWNGEASGGLRAAFDRITGPIAAAHAVVVPGFDAEFVGQMVASLFGPAVRSFYRHMLPRPDLLKPLATAGVPVPHRVAIQLAYPAWRWVMAKGLNLASHAPDADVASIGDAFAQVEARLADARFLGGDQPGIDDLLFAVLASPVLLPPEHPVRLPPLDTLPAPLGALITRFRHSRAGELALRTYASARRRD
ncbi:hypothetical protein ACQW02_21215 [Humitalea sp. 24SJ18S-53]|uniref:hypothetical protein n=1 Tax=Humitalea sp. 24SJ18S-53 TaxID=3422307 RepID=UPI003D679B18